MALPTPCQTPGATFRIEIRPERVVCGVDLPDRLDLHEQDARALEGNLHNAIELALAPYFSRRRVTPAAVAVDGDDGSGV
jgi:hypothetical protein